MSTSLRRALRRWKSLSWGNRWTLLRAYLWLTRVDLRLRTAGSRILMSRADDSVHARRGGTGGSVSNAAVLDRAVRYAYWLEIASRHHLIRARCLHRSLALQHWLRDEGIASELRIGVRKRDGVLAAHAWVEIAGQVVNDTPTSVAAFAPLTRPTMAPAVDGALQPMVRGVVWSKTLSWQE